MTKLSIVALTILACVAPASAQNTVQNTVTRRSEDRGMTCDRNGSNWNKLVSTCEIREQTIAFPGRLSVDPGMNGGVTVRGWDNASVLVRSKVEAAGTDEGAAKIVGSQVQVNNSGGSLSATGPETSNERNWSVSFEIFVPRRADLNLKTYNGGISITGVEGNIQFHAMNGGVNLRQLGGDVEGDTMNGGLNIDLHGDRWNGNKLSAKTTNGGVNITMPERYSAHFETATVNGRLNLDIPMTVRGEIGRRLSTEIGSGGPTIHIETTNGGVNVKRAAL
jgi:DUF4097 and DUF4098 domain-containing protein YvlB